VAFALGETIELLHDADVAGQQRDLDPATQTAQAQCDYCFQSLGARPLDIWTLRPVFGNPKTGTSVRC
jgi:hypothetical protein